jgi:hypothetical protein
MANVFNAASLNVGEVHPNGIVYSPLMVLVGVVEFSGSVLDRNAVMVGRVDAAGLIYDARGYLLGQVQPDHAVYMFAAGQPRAVYVGHVGQGIDDPHFIGGAVLLLIILRPS